MLIYLYENSNPKWSGIIIWIYKYFLKNLRGQKKLFESKYLHYMSNLEKDQIC